MKNSYGNPKKNKLYVVFVLLISGLVCLPYTMMAKDTDICQTLAKEEWKIDIGLAKSFSASELKNKKEIPLVILVNTPLYFKIMANEQIIKGGSLYAGNNPVTIPINDLFSQSKPYLYHLYLLKRQTIRQFDFTIAIQLKPPEALVGDTPLHFNKTNQSLEFDHRAKKQVSSVIDLIPRDYGPGGSIGYSIASYNPVTQCYENPGINIPAILFGIADLLKNKKAKKEQSKFIEEKLIKYQEFLIPNQAISASDAQITGSISVYFSDSSILADSTQNKD